MRPLLEKAMGSGYISCDIQYTLPACLLDLLSCSVYMCVHVFSPLIFLQASTFPYWPYIYVLYISLFTIHKERGRTDIYWVSATHQVVYNFVKSFHLHTIHEKWVFWPHFEGEQRPRDFSPSHLVSRSEVKIQISGLSASKSLLTDWINCFPMVFNAFSMILDFKDPL